MGDQIISQLNRVEEAAFAATRHAKCIHEVMTICQQMDRTQRALNKACLLLQQTEIDFNDFVDYTQHRQQQHIE